MVTLALRGELDRELRADARDFARARSTVYRRKGTIFQNRLRRQILTATGSTQLGNAVRKTVVPARGANPDITVTVFSSAIYSRPGGRVDLITILDEGATVHARDVPLLVGGRLAGKGGTRFARAQRVTIPKQLDVEGLYQATAADIDTQVLTEWDRLAERRGAL